MKKAIRLTKTTFDNLENRDGRTVEFEKIFMDVEGGLTAYGHLSLWFDAQPPEKRYMGWDMNIYPEYKIESVKINE